MQRDSPPLYSGSAILKHLHILYHNSTCFMYGHTYSTLVQIIYTGFTMTWLTNSLLNPVWVMCFACKIKLRNLRWFPTALQNGFLQLMVMSSNTATLGICGELSQGSSPVPAVLSKEKDGQTSITLSVMREQNNRCGTLQQRTGAMGNMESHPVSLTLPSHLKEQSKSCSRRTLYPTLQKSFMLIPTYGMGISGGMAQEASFVSALLSSLTPANPTAASCRKPVGCRESLPSPISLHTSQHTLVQRGDISDAEKKNSLHRQSPAHLLSAHHLWLA